MNIHRLFIISALLTSYNLSSAQYPLPIDSLNLELSNTRNVGDSVRILCLIAWNSSKTDANLTYDIGRQVLAALPRIQDNERKAEVYDAAALGYWVKGDVQKAEELYLEELHIGNQYHLSLRIAWAHYNLSGVLAKHGRLQEAKDHALNSRREFLQLSQMRWVVDRDQFLAKITQVDKSRNRYNDTAIADIQLALQLEKDRRRINDYYFSLINLYDRQGNKKQSMHYAMIALETAEQDKDTSVIISTCYRIGNYLRDYQHNYEVALLYYEKILELCKQLKNAGQETAAVLNDMGDVYKLMGENSYALSLYRESLALAEQIQHRHSRSNAYKNIGKIFYVNGEYAQALKYLEQSYAIGCDKCPQIAFHSVLIDIGNVYMRLGNYSQALTSYRKSLALADSSNAKYERAVSCFALGDFYARLKNSGQSLAYYRQAEDLAVGARALPLQRDIAASLSNAYKSQNDYHRAYEYLVLADKLTDSIKTSTAAENLSRLESKFEFQKLTAQKELELQQNRVKADAEISRQAQQKYFFIAAFLLVTVFGVVLYFGFRRKKRDSIILAEQKKQIEEMAKRVPEADQKKLNFFSNISHELRTPLTLILGPIEKLVKDFSSDQSKILLLQIVRRNTLQLYNLINQLLDIRKLDTGDTKLKVSMGDIAEYCKGICSTFVHVADTNNIQFSFTASPEKIIGWFDKGIIEKVLNNLLSNAFKYTGRNGQIHVCVSCFSPLGPDTQKINIVVRDNGRGIPSDHIQYVFDRYYQVENTNTGFNTGTGIGLAYAKELVGLHKGEIDAQSEPGCGTTFTVTIPIHKSYFVPDESIAAEDTDKISTTSEIQQKYLEQIIADHAIDIQAADKDGTDENKKVMLIVEDNEDVRTYIKGGFAGQFEIHEAEDGVQGFKSAAKYIPDIIVSDIMMPGMNGLEFCRKLKGNLHTSHIPVLILTAKAGEENELTGFRAGADDYLMKPFSFEILEARVNRLIESKKILRQYFTKEYLLRPGKIQPSTSMEDEFVRKAVKIVEDNIANPNLDIELLMRELAVSRTQLFRKLKATTNYSANQFIRNIKLKRAALLLQDKSYNVTEVLYQCGFNSPSYFSLCFKEMYGCLPKDYTAKATREVPHLEMNENME